MKITDIPEIERPREKLINRGAANLKNAELIAILFRSGRKGQNALELAEMVIKKYPEKDLINIHYNHLIELSGIDQGKACSLLAAIELGKRFYHITNKTALIINAPQDALKLLSDIRNLKKEHFYAIYLNARQQVIHQEVVSIGTLNASLVHPREVFEPAIKQLASVVLLAHNHPSGDESPSDADIAITKRLVKAGELMGIEIIDHIIVTSESYYSFREQNMI